jgi:hypothetical protein
MTDSDKLLAIANFLFCEGIRVEDTFKVVLSHKTVGYRNTDQLDYLELIQLMDRWEYFREFDAVISNILFGVNAKRPPWHPLDKRAH